MISAALDQFWTKPLSQPRRHRISADCATPPPLCVPALEPPRAIDTVVLCSTSFFRRCEEAADGHSYASHAREARRRPAHGYPALLVSIRWLCAVP